MIAVDTSALIAILLDEPEGPGCRAALEADESGVMSAGTLAEALLIAGHRNFADQVTAFIEAQGIEIEPVSVEDARRVAQAHLRWGKGVHPAGLNFGDCFAYALAQKLDCPLLFIGKDFSRTDVKAALG